MNRPLSHFHSWERLDVRALPEVFAEFAARGLRHLSLGGEASARMAEVPAYAELLRRESGRAGIAFLNAHAPHAPAWELNSPDDAPRQRHRALLDRFAELGCETVTVHAGTNDGGEPLARLRERTSRSLDVLVRRARELGMTIVLENTVFPTDTPAELAQYARRFRGEAFGFCFDAGHANLMDAAAGKRSCDMVEWIARRWNGEVRFETDTLAALLPDIVTCHLHDNDGFDDQHLPPGNGNIDWPRLLSHLEGAPRLRSYQNETNHWRHGFDAARIAATFARLWQPEATVATA